MVLLESITALKTATERKVQKQLADTPATVSLAEAMTAAQVASRKLRLTVAVTKAEEARRREPLSAPAPKVRPIGATLALLLAAAKTPSRVRPTTAKTFVAIETAKATTFRAMLGPAAEPAGVPNVVVVPRPPVVPKPPLLGVVTGRLATEMAVLMLDLPSPARSAFLTQPVGRQEEAMSAGQILDPQPTTAPPEVGQGTLPAEAVRRGLAQGLVPAIADTPRQNGPAVPASRRSAIAAALWLEPFMDVAIYVSHPDTRVHVVPVRATPLVSQGTDVLPAVQAATGPFLPDATQEVLQAGPTAKSGTGAPYFSESALT